MHSYQHNIKTFNSATRHLTRVERSLYRDLIELYYDMEQPLQSTDFSRLCRQVLAHSDEEKEALKYVLGEFFTLTGDVYTHNYCDEQIEKYKTGISAKAKAGVASAEAKKQKAAQRIDERTNKKEHMNNVLSTERNTCSTVVTNQEPITNNHKPRTKNQSHTGSHEILDAEPEDEKSMRDEPAEILNAESKAVGSPTLAGAICVALRANGAAANEVNPANPTLLKLISDGATIDHFVASFSKAKDAGAAKPFLYMLTVVASELQAAAKIGNARASPSGLQQNKQEQLEKANALRAQSFIEKMEQQQRGTS